MLEKIYGVFRPLKDGVSSTFRVARWQNLIPSLSLDCARVEGEGGAIQAKEGIKFFSIV